MKASELPEMVIRDDEILINGERFPYVVAATIDGGCQVKQSLADGTVIPVQVVLYLRKVRDERSLILGEPYTIVTERHLGDDPIPAEEFMAWWNGQS